MADGRCSLSVVEDGLRDVQAGARLTLVADAQRIEPEPALLQRFCRYQAAAENLLQLDFMFFRLQPLRLRYIGGVGRMGWLEAAELDGLPLLTLEDEAALLREAVVADGIQLLGLDALGADYRLADTPGHRRLRWPDSMPSGEGFAAAALQALAALSPD